jgi:carbon monoxide dehydrogenase subunit G
VKLAGEYEFEAPVGEVWTALLDPVVLAAVMPGCEKLELVDDTYVGELDIKVGPVQGKFQGKVKLSDVEEEKGTSRRRRATPSMWTDEASRASSKPPHR